jgi:hypothetical protein
MPSTVRRRDRPHRLPSFAAIAGVAGALAAGLISRSLPRKRVPQPPALGPQWHKCPLDVVFRAGTHSTTAGEASQWRARTPSTTATTRSSAPGTAAPMVTAPSPRTAATALASASRAARTVLRYCWRRGWSRRAAALLGARADHPPIFRPPQDGIPAPTHPARRCSTFATYAGLRPLCVRCR